MTYVASSVCSRERILLKKHRIPGQKKNVKLGEGESARKTKSRVCRRDEIAPLIQITRPAGTRLLQHLVL